MLTATNNNHPAPADLQSIIAEMAAHIARLKRLPPHPLRLEIGRRRWEAIKAAMGENSPTIEFYPDRPVRTFSGLELRVLENWIARDVADVIYSDGSRRPL